jgi:hypothetical protein
VQGCWGADSAPSTQLDTRCGRLRMLYSLLHCDLSAVVRFNALGLVAVALLVWAYVAWTYGHFG